MRDGIARGIIGGLLGSALYNVFILILKATVIPHLDVYIQLLVSIAGSLYILYLNFKKDDMKLISKRIDDMDKIKADRVEVDYKVNTINKKIEDNQENERERYDQLFEMISVVQSQTTAIYEKLISKL